MTLVNCNSYYSVTSLTGRKLNGSLQSILCHKTLKLYNNHKKFIFKKKFQKERHIF